MGDRGSKTSIHVCLNTTAIGHTIDWRLKRHARSTLLLRRCGGCSDGNMTGNVITLHTIDAIHSSRMVDLLSSWHATLTTLWLTRCCLTSLTLTPGCLYGRLFHVSRDSDALMLLR